MDDLFDPLEKHAEIEAQFWPSIYLAPNLLAEAIFFCLFCITVESDQ